MRCKFLNRFILLLLLMLLLFSLYTYTASAQTISDTEESVDSLYGQLPKQAQQDLSSIGADTTDIATLSDVGFSKILELINNKFLDSSTNVLGSCSVVIAILLLCAILEGYKDSLSLTSLDFVFDVVCTLCITTALLTPVVNLINDSIATITDASDFMLFYIPIMISILAFSGHAVSAGGYYSFMVMACQVVSQLSTKFISPLLTVYLGFCVSSSINNRVNLHGFTNMFSKVIKWFVSFLMTVFSALLTIRSMITTAYDSVTARAVRFTMSSFIPIVGAALAESYKTIQGSINLLRTGAGVFVIFAIFVVFLPTVIRCVLWLFSINICKSVAQLTGVKTPVSLLSSISSAISIIFAITVCIMAVFIISTALLISLGGRASG